MRYFYSKLWVKEKGERKIEHKKSKKARNGKKVNWFCFPF